MAHHTRDQTLCSSVTRERALDAHGVGAIDGRLDLAHCTAVIHYRSQTSSDCSDTAGSDMSLSILSHGNCGCNTLSRSRTTTECVSSLL